MRKGAEFMPEDEPVLRYTPGEWLCCVRALIRALALVVASGWDTAVMRRETERMRAAMTAPALRTGRRYSDAKRGPRARIGR
jgi:hypothetical protein